MVQFTYYLGIEFLRNLLVAYLTLKNSATRN